VVRRQQKWPGRFTTGLERFPYRTDHLLFRSCRHKKNDWASHERPSSAFRTQGTDFHGSDSVWSWREFTAAMTRIAQKRWRQSSGNKLTRGTSWIRNSINSYKRPHRLACLNAIARQLASCAENVGWRLLCDGPIRSEKDVIQNSNTHNSRRVAGRNAMWSDQKW
jgi:hypothetical protein